MSLRHSCCTFTLGRRWFGLPVDRVREVLRHPAVTRVPLAPPELAGLINIRGEVILAIDLRVRLGIAPAHPERPPIDLILHGKSGVFSLLADEIGPVLETRENAAEPIPETVPAVARSVISGAYPMGDRLLLVLDPDKITAAGDGESGRGGRT